MWIILSQTINLCQWEIFTCSLKLFTAFKTMDNNYLNFDNTKKNFKTTLWIIFKLWVINIIENRIPEKKKNNALKYLSFIHKPELRFHYRFLSVQNQTKKWSFENLPPFDLVYAFLSRSFRFFSHFWPVVWHLWRFIWALITATCNSAAKHQLHIEFFFGNVAVRVGTQGLFRPCLKTFVAPFLPARLTAPGSPRMAKLGMEEGRELES